MSHWTIAWGAEMLGDAIWQTCPDCNAVVSMDGWDSMEVYDLPWYPGLRHIGREVHLLSMCGRCGATWATELE